VGPAEAAGAGLDEPERTDLFTSTSLGLWWP